MLIYCLKMFCRFRVNVKAVIVIARLRFCNRRAGTVFGHNILCGCPSVVMMWFRGVHQNDPMYINLDTSKFVG